MERRGIITLNKLLDAAACIDLYKFSPYAWYEKKKQKEIRPEVIYY